jgi:hypothetical protein
MSKKIAIIVFIALLQLLWTTANACSWSTRQRHCHAIKISMGFPVNCVSYTLVRDNGKVPISWAENYPELNQYLPGIKILPVFLILDAIIAFAFFIGLCRLFRKNMYHAAVTGLSLGVMAYAIAIICTVSVLHPFSDGIFASFLLVVIPSTICIVTRRVRSVWQPLLILAIAVCVMTWIYYRCGHIDFSFKATDSTSLPGRMTFDDMITVPLIIFGFLSLEIVIFRRFVSFFKFKKSDAVDGSQNN